MTDLTRIAELSAQGHGYRAIADQLGESHWAVRKALREIVGPRKSAVEIIAPYPAKDAPASAWAERITACWQSSVGAILEVGRLLAGAKEALPHGEFGKMIEADLPFGERTAQMLMAIADDPRLSNPKHISLLPPAWGTLYDLTKWNDEQFEAGVRDGKIRPDMERREAVNGARAVMASRQEADDSLDYFPTPPWATRALVQHVLPVAGFADKRFRSVWEPACGEGHMAEILAEYADDVRANDVFNYGYGGVRDFFAASYEPRPDWIVTNPPFGDKSEQFVLHAIGIANVGVAMFLRSQWLETVGRYERVFKPYPPRLIAQFAERVPLHRGRWEPDGDTATAYLWIAWTKQKPAHTEFMWIPPGCRESLTHPDDVERFTAHPVIKKSERDAVLSDPPAASSEPVPMATDTPAASGADSPLSDTRAA